MSIVQITYNIDIHFQYFTGKVVAILLNSELSLKQKQQTTSGQHGPECGQKDNQKCTGNFFEVCSESF